jgi:hypothetical protein
MVTVQDYRISIVAVACWRASQPQVWGAGLFCGMVFMNQSKAGWFEGDVYECAKHWLMENQGPFPDTRDPQFQQMLFRLGPILDGRVADRTDGALWFAWRSSVDKIAGAVTATFGDLVFVR